MTGLIFHGILKLNGTLSLKINSVDNPSADCFIVGLQFLKYQILINKKSICLLFYTLEHWDTYNSAEIFHEVWSIISEVWCDVGNK